MLAGALAEPAHRRRPEADFVDAGPRAKPGDGAWLGTDGVGRDVYARIIYGARPILIVAPLATGIAIVVGTLLGLVMGYYRGWVDEMLSRIIEAILSIPVILMAILVVFTFGRSTPVIIGTIAILFVPGDHPNDPVGGDRRSPNSTT